MLVYFFITSGIKKNVTTNYPSLAESANASANLQNFGETSPDAISTNSEGAQENQDLVIISERFCEEKCQPQGCFTFISYLIWAHFMTYIK